MNEPTTEQLMAFADGELSPTEHERIAAQVAASPELQQIVAAFTRSSALLREVFDERLDEPVPQRLIDAVRNYQPQAQDAAAPQPTAAAEIKPLPGIGEQQAGNLAAVRRPAANYSRMAIAATITLTVGILAGLMLQGGDNNDGPACLRRHRRGDIAGGDGNQSEWRNPERPPQRHHPAGQLRGA